MNFKDFINTNELKRSSELLNCFREISNGEPVEVTFAKMIRLITIICEKAITFDQSILTGELIANFANSSTGSDYQFDDVSFNISWEKCKRGKKEEFCRIHILHSFMADAYYFCKNDEKLFHGYKKMNDFLQLLHPKPTSPFNNEDSYA